MIIVGDPAGMSQPGFFNSAWMVTFSTLLF
jgi:hypothetical protein